MVATFAAFCPRPDWPSGSARSLRSCPESNATRERSKQKKSWELSICAVMVACAENMLKTWQSGQTRDLHADMTRLTMEIAGQTLLGASMADGAERVSRAMND